MEIDTDTITLLPISICCRKPNHAILHYHGDLAVRRERTRSAQEQRTVVIRVLAEDKAATGAKVWVHARGDDGADSRPMITDAAGKVTAKIPAPGPQFANAFARDAQGRVGQIDSLRVNQFDRPLEIDLVLLDIEKRSGRVTDAEGQPIAGADIVPTYFSRLKDTAGGDERRPRSITLSEWNGLRQTVRTDKDGRFAVVGVPKGFGLSFTVKAAGYGETTFHGAGDSPIEVKLAAPGTVVLRFSGLANVEKLNGVSFTIQPKGTKSAKSGMTEPFRSRHDELDGKPEFAIPNVVPGRYGLKLWQRPQVPGVPAAVEEFEVTAGGKTVVPVAFTPAAKLTGKITDQATGKGLPGVKVTVVRAGQATPTSILTVRSKRMRWGITSLTVRRIGIR